MSSAIAGKALPSSTRAAAAPLMIVFMMRPQMVGLASCGRGAKSDSGAAALQPLFTGAEPR
ncbi:hypothetical protein D3C72_2016760 [compost metagenome]